MSSAWNHRKRSHLSEKAHVECARQMMQFSPMAGALLPWGLGVLAPAVGRRTGRRASKKRSAQ